MKLRSLGGLAGAALFAAVACQGTGTASSGTSVTGATTGASTGAQSAGASAATSGGATKGTLKIGVDLPLSGGEVANGGPTFNGIQLAVDEANAAGGVAGYKLDINKQDDAVNGVHNPQQGASNAKTLVADTSVVGMVGPFNSNVARAIIPVTNEAGLAQCSPSNTAIDLTKAGSEKLRPKNPDKRNYFRVATPDDIQGPAGAQYAYNDLGKRSAYVIDDTEAFGVGVGNSFSDEFQRLGGKIVKRDSNNYATNKDFSAFLTAVKPLNPDVVYFAGTQSNGGGQFRKQMGQAAMLSIPMVGPDGIADTQPGGSEGAFITLAGVENSANVHGTVAGIHDIPNPEAFGGKYQAKFTQPPGAYSALAYACTQVLIQALTAAAGQATDPAAIREAVRAHVFGGNTYQTVLGPLTFDPNGDSSQKFISFYKVDPSLNGGKGGWVFVRQQDFSNAGGAGGSGAPGASGSAAPGGAGSGAPGASDSTAPGGGSAAPGASESTGAGGGSGSAAPGASDSTAPGASAASPSPS